MGKVIKKLVLIKKFKKLQRIIENKYLSQDLHITTPLYHFTNKDAFLKIVTSKKLLLSRFNELNDKDEFEFTKKIIEKILNENPSKYSIKYISGFNWFVSKLDLYTFSFCSNLNNNHLWEKYSDANTGLALGFKLNYNSSAKFDYINDWPQVCLAVKYGESVLKNDLAEFTEVFSELLKLLNNDKQFEKYADIFARNIYVSMPRYKADIWQEEKEHRWCMMDRGPSKKIPDKFKSEGKVVLENIILDQLCEIVIGKASSESADSVSELLRTHGYDLSKINITRQS